MFHETPPILHRFIPNSVGIQAQNPPVIPPQPRRPSTAPPSRSRSLAYTGAGNKNPASYVMSEEATDPEKARKVWEQSEKLAGLTSQLAANDFGLVEDRDLPCYR